MIITADTAIVDMEAMATADIVDTDTVDIVDMEVMDTAEVGTADMVIAVTVDTVAVGMDTVVIAPLDTVEVDTDIAEEVKRMMNRVRNKFTNRIDTLF